MFYILLVFVLIGGQPHALGGGPFKSMKECETAMAETKAEAEKDKSVQAYGLACVTANAPKGVAI